METLKKIRNVLIYGDAEQRKLEEIYETLNENNRTSVQMLSLIAVICLALLTLASFAVASLERFRMIYFGGFLVVTVIFLLAKYRAKGNHFLTLVLMYVLVSMLFLVGIVMGTVASPNELTAAYIALMLTAPQLFTDRPWQFIALIYASVVIFICMVLKFKDPVTWSSDIVNAIVFSTLSSVICAYNMKIKVERLHLENTVRNLAETDQLTSLRNRHCYEQRLAESAAILKTESVYCVYVDVNGLHELNDREGHTAGDRMLQYVATVMQNVFGKSDTFRIGGDEFVAIGVNRSMEELESMVDRLKVAVEAAGYHVAVGMDQRSRPQSGMDDLIRQAELKMYKDKSEYYQKSGIDRRRRR